MHELGPLVDVASLVLGVKELFDTSGEVLLYFYGHGCADAFGKGILAVSNARQYAEGVAMANVVTLANNSTAREAILVFDCCHAGAALAPDAGPAVPPVNRDEIRSVAQVGPGRAVLAACSADQNGWETENPDGLLLGGFSWHALRGLEGEALPRGTSWIRSSSLGTFITDQFRAWNQSPVVVTQETGDRLCIITSGFASEDSNGKDAASNHESQIIGAPFQPSQLFVGREAELDDLKSKLLDSDRRVAISATVEGLGGIGKTELVIQLLHDREIRKSFRTILWIDAAGPIPPQLRKACIELGCNPSEDVDELIVFLGRELRTKGKSLIVLDNATEWQPIARLVPSGPQVLVTTRTRDFGGASFSHAELGVLSPGSSRKFLCGIVPQLERDPRLDELVKALEGHALALELAGWSMRYLELDAAAYLDRLAKHQPPPGTAKQHTRYGASVDECLSATWSSLSESAQSLWRRAALFAPTSAHRDLLSISFIGSPELRDKADWLAQKGGLASFINFAEADRASFQTAYAELRSFHVLARVEGAGERWAMHRMVRDFGRTHVSQADRTWHSIALGDWLKHPHLRLGPEVPHFVVAILDAAQHVIQLRERGGASRAFGREILLGSQLGSGFDAREVIFFIRDELNDPAALTLILDGLADTNERVRIQAIELIETVGPIPEMVRGLVAALDDPDRTVRDRAAMTLAAHGSEKTLSILEQVLQGNRPRARSSAVNALCWMKIDAGPVIERALGNDDERVRLEAAIFLCNRGSHAGVEVLTAELAKSPNDGPRIVDALGKSNDTRVLSVLRDLVVHATTGALGAAAVQVLGKLDRAKSYPVFVKGLGSSHREVRAEAAEIIYDMDRLEYPSDIIKPLEISLNKAEGVGLLDRRFVSLALQIVTRHRFRLSSELFSKCAHSESWEIRQNVAMALRTLGTKEDTPLLVALLSDRDYDVRREAARALGQIGHTDDPVISALVNVLNDSGIGVSNAAARALTRLLDEAEVQRLLESFGDAQQEQCRASLTEAISLSRVSAASRDSEDVRALLSQVAAQNSAEGTAAREGFLDRLAMEIEVGFFSRILDSARSSSDVRMRRAAAAALVFWRHSHAGNSHDEPRSVLEAIKGDRQALSSGLLLLSGLKTFDRDKTSALLSYVATQASELQGDATLIEQLRLMRGRGQSFPHIDIVLAFLGRGECELPVDEIVRLHSGGTPTTQLSCAFALWLLGDERATQTLTQNVSNGDIDIRTAVATCLEGSEDSSRVVTRVMAPS